MIIQCENLNLILKTNKCYVWLCDTLLHIAWLYLQLVEEESHGILLLLILLLLLLLVIPTVVKACITISPYQETDQEPEPIMCARTDLGPKPIRGQNLSWRPEPIRGQIR